MSQEEHEQEIAQIAAAIEEALPRDDREKLFDTAVEAGFLAALADKRVQDAERKAIDDALFGISKGIVIDWEVDALINRATKRISEEGNAKRATAVGETLKALGQAETGVLIAALVALASRGVSKKELGVLKRIGKAADLDEDAVAAIVERARKLAG